MTTTEELTGRTPEQEKWISMRDRLKSQSMTMGFVSTLVMAGAVGVLINAVHNHRESVLSATEDAGVYISLNWITVGMIGLSLLIEIVGAVIYRLRMRRLGLYPGARQSPPFGRKIIYTIIAAALIDVSILIVAGVTIYQSSGL